MLPNKVRLLHAYNPDAIWAAMEDLTAHWGEDFHIAGLDTEFYGGAYPDSVLTHVQIADEETSVVFEVHAPECLDAFAQAWHHYDLSRAQFFMHYGQDDLMLLMRAGCDIKSIWDSGTIANHLSLMNTALKFLAQEYHIDNNVMSYAQLLKEIVPAAELLQYVNKAGDVIQAYDLSKVARHESHFKTVLDYVANDPYLALKVGIYMSTSILPQIYDADTIHILEDAQFKSALLLARHNQKGYGINEKVLFDTIEQVQAEADELEREGRQMVREAMGWDLNAPPSALTLLNDPKPAAPKAQPQYAEPIVPPTAVITFSLDGSYKTSES